MSLVLMGTIQSQAQEKPAAPIVVERSKADDFRLATKKNAAPLYINAADARVVQIATQSLASDIESVTGNKPRVSSGAIQNSDYAVFIGTLGYNPLIDKLVAAKKLDVQGIQGAWESYLIATVPNPVPGVRQGLVIAGSDRRGTAYGAFTLSEAIGVSPWSWWADVPTRRRDTLFVRTGVYRQNSPAVKYRGIFINDEDWGLQPWAAKNFEPETNDIGPKTYARVCELLLRLKANYLWPAMHDVTKAFNHYPQNKVVADEYAIVMGSSHAEPMLRNNVSEWDKEKYGDWNPVTNLPKVLDYWDQRVRENGKYENTWTVGMRGIHDGAMPGGGTLTEKRDRLQNIIGLQRDMLAKYVNPDPTRVPQIFVPYKEVLDIYQTGLKLPNDITLVWPEDNFGYIRQLPDLQERQRSGGSGIYYHLSYWGRPHDYLWLDSTSPVLIWHEMTKAYEFNARQLWVVNVGDIKSVETGTDLFLKLAWNPKRYGPDVQKTFLRDFYTQQFGEKYADRLAALRDEYYRLCAIRRPEHMGFNRVYYSREVKNTPVANSDWSHTPENDEARRILERWQSLARQAEALEKELPQESRDAYFQLVEYPACAGAAMVEKIILAEKARLSGSTEQAQQAQAAFERIGQLTDRYNAQNGGKWRGIMDYRPRKLPVFDMPPTAPQVTTTATTPIVFPAGKAIEIDPTKFTQVQDRDGAGWRIIEGLGPRGKALSVLPQKDVPTRLSPQEIRAQTPCAEYTVTSNQAGEVEITVEALPTHRLTPQHEVIAALSINDEDPIVVHFDEGKDDENDRTWQTNVLRNAMLGKATLRVPNAPYKLKLWAADPGVVVQHLTLTPKGATPGT